MLTPGLYILVQQYWPGEKEKANSNIHTVQIIQDSSFIYICTHVWKDIQISAIHYHCFHIQQYRYISDYPRSNRKRLWLQIAKTHRKEKKKKMAMLIAFLKSNLTGQKPRITVLCLTYLFQSNWIVINIQARQKQFPLPLSSL